MQNTEQDTSGASSSPARERRPAASRPSSSRLNSGAILLLALVIAGVFATGLFAGWQFASARMQQVRTNSGPSTSTLNSATSDKQREAIIGRIRPAVVEIHVVTAQGNEEGSGVIIDTRGYIITNYHIIQKATMLYAVLFDGRILPAQITGTDPPDDLAVIQVNSARASLPIALLGDSSKLELGQAVLALGSPLGITQNVTSGIISALNSSVSTIPDAIQTDAAINPGNSGGALVDLQGNLVGLLTSVAATSRAGTPTTGMSFAIPSNRVALIASQLIEAGKITSSGRASLGFRGSDVDAALAAQNGLAISSGVFIVAVEPGGPVDQAGLNPGDVIVQIDGIATPDNSSLNNVLLSRNPGDTVSIRIYRGERQLLVKVKLGELQLT